MLPVDWPPRPTTRQGTVHGPARHAPCARRAQLGHWSISTVGLTAGFSTGAQRVGGEQLTADDRCPLSSFCGKEKAALAISARTAALDCSCRIPAHHGAAGPSSP